MSTKANNTYLTESQKLFNQVFKLQLHKIRNTPNTIFENLDYISENSFYMQFIDSSYYDKTIQSNNNIEKQAIIKNFITESLSNIYYSVKTELYKDNNPTFSQHFLLENTLDVFPELVKTDMSATLFEECVHITQSDNPERYKELEESGFLYPALAGGATVALGGSMLGAIGIALSTRLAMEIFLPTKWTISADRNILGFVTFLTRSLLGTSSLLGKFGSFKYSQQALETFDNLNLNKDMMQIFEKIGQRHSFNNGQGAESLNVIVAKCIDANREIFDKNNFFTRTFSFNGTNGNLYRNIVNSMFVNNGNKNSTNGQTYDKLLRFRKCIASSLSDLYKFTMITNLKDVKNYEQILKAAGSGFDSNPERLLNFVDIRNDYAQDIKENLLDLIKLRILINEMIKTFKNGAFGVDQEAGQFLEQKFRLVDKEIAEYLRSQKQAVDIFDKKEYNNIPAKSNSPFSKTYRPIIQSNQQVQAAPTTDENSGEHSKPNRLDFL
jgi:hypothetical protein